MKVFHCGHCDNLLFFENVHCLRCNRTIAFLPDLNELDALEPADGKWQCGQALGAAKYRLCANFTGANVCNWAIPAADPHSLCQSCRLTRTVPDLERPGNREAWYKLEVAKRRLVYSLVELKLPLLSKDEDPEHGLAFQFLADPTEPDAKPVLTGHADGVITINVAEADDAQREKRRLALYEPYRTLLGHFRHEIGHYYWDRLIRRSSRLADFRQLFGDEQADYAQALQRHYEQGAPADWQQSFVTAYASAHPWEDWAESWAHYLHMTDTLETAAALGLAARPRRLDEPALKTSVRTLATFDVMLANWFSLTYVLNNLNRGLGLPDAYPFVLAPTAVEKLRFMDATVRECGA
jgi:hypothetical protein